ncbi:NAD(P)/FAD-dependent oxidoreductase [Kribbella sp. VKM Ac-2568]|uniref:NAD(P)/FAD-dependent oxidoreductase n=1 Tax=Kribbella sp. VKM Ac-2568 TaxID=2512219 RepID=UPI001A7EB974|nr:FAD-dependent oxidoreductase [Kribbella sp. VKM Ac-2568]
MEVVVIGAGYAGAIATNRLLASLTEAERRHLRVRVINPRADFVERIRLHQLAAGSRESVTLPLADVLHEAAELIVGSAKMINPDDREVTVATADGEMMLHYDHMIYALGSVAAAPVPGARENAFLLADVDDAERAAAAINGCDRGQQVVVVGGGLTGVEAASEIAERHSDVNVMLVSAGPVLGFMRPAARRSILRSLCRLGVRVEAGVAVSAIEGGQIKLADGREIDFDVCLMAASFAVPDLAKVSGLAVDDAGRLRVDEYLRALDAPRVVAAGDAMAAPDVVGRHLRMGCASALPLGAHAAGTVLAAIRGQEPTRVSVGYVVQCISLGRRRGYIQAVRADDSPRPFHLGGRPAAMVKETICAMVLDAPRNERTKPGSYTSPKGPRVAA